jgi:hypothetical protein
MGAAEGDAQRRRPQVRIPPSPFLGAGKRMGELAAPLLDSVTAALEVRPVSESRSLGLAPGCSIAAVVVWRAQRSSDTAPVPSQGATALARKLPPNLIEKAFSRSLDLINPLRDLERTPSTVRGAPAKGSLPAERHVLQAQR